MTVDAILKLVAALTDDERAELLDKLRAQYGPGGGESSPSSPDQTGIYSLDQIVRRVRRGS